MNEISIFLSVIACLEAIAIILQAVFYAQQMEKVHEKLIARNLTEYKTVRGEIPKGPDNEMAAKNDDWVSLDEDTPVDLSKKYNIEFQVDGQTVNALTGKQ